MTLKERVDIKNKILETIKELSVEIELMQDGNKPIAPDNAYGRLSRMEAIGSKAISDAAFSDMKVTLQRLKFALSNIESNRYGICNKCKQDISVPRLMAVPYATLCINCAQKR